MAAICTHCQARIVYLISSNGPIVAVDLTTATPGDRKFDPARHVLHECEEPGRETDPERKGQPCPT